MKPRSPEGPIGRVPPICPACIHMEFKFITKTLVYQYAGLSQPRAVLSFEPQDDWRIADPELVKTTFEHDAKRIRRFREYLRFRHAGLILLRGRLWISYGWCATPEAVGPPHLPGWTRSLDAYWIFGCHTHERFRGRGVYKQLLARLTSLVLAKQPSATILVDTHAENVAARRAIVASGFQPRGVFSTYRVWAPLTGARIIGGRWRRDETHPVLACGVSRNPANAAAAPIQGRATYKIATGNSAANAANLD